MKSRLIISMFVIGILMNYSHSFAANILVWDKDNNSVFQEPDNNRYVSCETGIKNALDANGCTYTTVRSLPTSLADYDIIFIVLGFFCPS